MKKSEERRVKSETLEWSGKYKMLDKAFVFV